MKQEVGAAFEEMGGGSFGREMIGAVGSGPVDVPAKSAKALLGKPFLIIQSFTMANKAPSSNTTPPKINTSNTAAGEYLLERLRVLLNRLQAATEILHKWPEARGDSAKIHAETATELIASIRKIALAARTIERHINGTSTSETTTPQGVIPIESLEAFRKSLDDKCPIPLDLLDLLDVGAIFGMNPQVYARGLMKEAMRQLAGLERRKRGLGMLADAIEKGMAKSSTDTVKEAFAATAHNENDALSEKHQAKEECDIIKVKDISNKRKREDDDTTDHILKKERVETEE